MDRSVKKRWLKAGAMLLWLATAGVLLWAAVLFVLPIYLRHAAIEELKQLGDGPISEERGCFV